MNLEITFLGTSGAVPTTERNTSGILLRREGERLLFDVGEGTQRQMMHFATGFDISAIFLTHLHGDHILGLPGLLQTMDFNDRMTPLHIYTPTGTVDEIENFLSGTDTKPNYPVHVHQASAGSTIYDSKEYVINVFETAHGTRSVGYTLVETERKGRFNRARAEELGVPVGPKFQQLHDGTPVELDDGTVIHPDEVVGDHRPGRKIVYTGDTRPTETVVSAATGADLLIHDAMFSAEQGDRAQYTDHSTARQAATVGTRANVERLALTHISSRYTNHVAPLEREAIEVFGEHVFLPDDGDSVTIPYPDADSS